MVEPRSDVPAEDKRYGLELWPHRDGPSVSLEGYDAGVSFPSVHDPTIGLTRTVLANTSAGAWPMIASSKRSTRVLGSSRAMP